MISSATALALCTLLLAPAPVAVADDEESGGNPQVCAPLCQGEGLVGNHGEGADRQGEHGKGKGGDHERGGQHLGKGLAAPELGDDQLAQSRVPVPVTARPGTATTTRPVTVAPVSSARPVAVGPLSSTRSVVLAPSPGRAVSAPAGPARALPAPPAAVAPPPAPGVQRPGAVIGGAAVTPVPPVSLPQPPVHPGVTGAGSGVVWTEAAVAAALLALAFAAAGVVRRRQ